ncbi:unnamed protein product [Caenorhabditis bovis]|uniref:Uncharacterized protein n=1 Tax=Caenorhabditis bovis TaxID=2654633 RepID=A0A8S1F7U1_9PELO|nr:unnamed protein product [Caenorhabditis bovis]
MIGKRIAHQNISFSRVLSSAPSTSKAKSKVNCAVYGCGLSASGALAIPKLVHNNNTFVTAPEAKFPKRITFFNTENIRHISAGFGFSLFASNKKLYGAGLNNRFQIGGHIADMERRRGQEYYISAKKIKIPMNENDKILGISSGRAHSLILTTNGVYAIGENQYGQCGVNPDLSNTSVGVGDSPLQKIQVGSDYPIVGVHCSLDSSFLLNKAGEVFAFGLNEDGQCANEEYGIQWKPSKIKGDAAGVKIKLVTGSTDTLMAISETGQLFIWGQTEYNQATEACSDIQLNVSRQICISSRIGKIVSAASTSTSCAVANDSGEVYVWGVGVLGLGPNCDRLARPTKMDQPLFDDKKVTNVFGGNCNFGAFNSNGRLYVWGENRFATIGLGHMNRQLFPYQLFVPGDIRSVSLGPDHSLILIH